MRALIEHRRTYYCASTVFSLSAVNFSAINDPASKRDVYIRTFGKTGALTHANIYLFKTFAEAYAVTSSPSKTADGVIAYAEDVTLDGSAQTISVTNYAAVAPDMTGTTLTINGAGTSTAWGALHCYSSAPGPLVAAEIDYLLGQRMSAGQSLYGFVSGNIVKGPDGLVIESTAPSVLITIAEETDLVAEMGYYAVGVNFSVIVGSRGFQSKGETNYDNVQNYAGAIRSLLGDEYNTLNNVCSEVVIGSAEGPSLIAGQDEAIYVAARVNGHARFPVLQSDR